MIATVTDPHYIDNTLVPSHSYSYTVRALDAANNLSVDSAAFAVTANGGSLPLPWWHTEIGDVGVIGSADFSAGSFNLQGSGSDIWGTADTFHFMYQPLSGDGEILARVASQEYTSPTALTGLMIRETLTDASRYAFVLVSPGTWSEFDYRATTGGAAASTGTISGISLPYWFKLTRTGNTFSAFRSPDGATWTALGASQTLSMSTDTYIGLAVTSNDNSVLGSVSMSNVNLQVDNDHDGLNDPWEIQYFGNLDQSPSGDPDGDGLSNLQEYQNGTNPTDYFNGMAPTLEIVSGDNQSAAPDTFLPQPLVVRVKTGAGGALPNAPVTFHVESGGGQLGIDNIDTVADPYLMRTDAAGLAAIYFKEPINGSGESAISATCSTAGQTVSVGFSAFVSSLALSPAGLSVQLTAGETRDETLILSNTGGATSSFCLETPTSTYGYVDSDHTGGPVYGWSDISSTGTLLSQISNADNSYEGFSLTFSFPDHDQSFTEVFISSNGFITFGEGSDQSDNYELPRVDMPSNIIAPFHVDLNPGESGDIFYLNEATRTIIQFENVARRDSVGSVTFQVMLNDDGTIQFLYKNLPTVSDDVTVGLQNGTRDEGLTISYGSAYLHPGLAIEIYPSSGNSKWFGVSPTEGSAVPGVPQTISVHFDATSLAAGVYSGVLELGTDCISLPLEAIPITMTVAKSPDDDGDGLPDDWEMHTSAISGKLRKEISTATE